MIIVRANARNATYISDDLITSGSVGIPVTFNLSEEFDGLSCIAVFEGSGVSIDVALMDNTCVVPHEVVATAGGYLRIGIYASNSAGTIVIPTVWAGSKMILQGTTPSEVDPSAPTPSWVAQVQEAAAEALANSEEAIEIAGGADAAAEEARQSASAAAASATAAGQSASAAGTAQTEAEAAQTAAVSARDAAVAAQGNAESSAQAAAGNATAAAGSAAAAAASEAAAREVEESIPADYTDLSNEVSDLKSHLDETFKNSENLAWGHTLKEKTLWNCWTATVYEQANDNYYCLEFDLPANAEYISSNYTWANNSFSAFVDDNYNKIALIRDSVTTGNVYAVPSGATKACISFPVSDYDTKYNSIGVVYIVGQTNITNKTVDDYSPQTFYFADNLLLKAENDKTVGAVVSGLVDVSEQFIEKKNLFAEITTGKYSIAWNVGDTVTFGDGAKYAYGIADVEGLTNVTINLINMSDAYSFFTDAQNKKVASSADNRVGTTRVYNVPSGAKYFYVSSPDRATWTQYGFVMLEGTDDIVTNPVSISQYPYDTTVFFADNLMLSNGLTVGEALETASKVYHVEKDGSGDYDSLVAAIQEAVKYNNSIVYVGAGTWDIVDEFGSTYMESVTSNPLTWGLELKNNIHIIGTSKTIIQARYTGTTQNTREYFSAFNAGAYGFTLENVTIVADNIRYVIHDDRGSGGSTPYVNKYINCDMKLTNGYYGDTVIGGGLGINGTIEIRNCRFEGSAGTHRLAYYHGNNYSGETGAKCVIIVQGCYFAGDGSFDVTKYGDSTEMSTAYLSNNSFGSAPQVTSGSYAPQDNMQIVAWNNEIRT